MTYKCRIKVDVSPQFNMLSNDWHNQLASHYCHLRKLNEVDSIIETVTKRLMKIENLSTLLSELALLLKYHFVFLFADT